MKTAAIIQNRIGSTRFPGKCFKKIGEKNSTEWIIDRLLRCHYIDKIILAVPSGEAEEIKGNITCFYDNKIFTIFEGSETDPMQRVIDAAETHNVDIIVDITADCPFVDPEKIDTAVLAIKNLGDDYCSNVYPDRSSIDGFDIQAYLTEYLKTTQDDMLINNIINDHVGWNIPYAFRHINFSRLNRHTKFKIYYDKWAVTLDEPDDLILLNKIYGHFKRYDMTEKEIMEYLIANQSILNINKDVKRKIPGE